MIPIPDRTDFAYIAQQHFFLTGRAVEVGAYRGEFAKHNMKTWKGEYHIVDTWGPRPADTERGLDDKNTQEDWEDVMNSVRENARFAVKHKGYSVEVANTFSDEHFDWIFIDAGHDAVNFRADLEAWLPKLRKGGLMSGDDYGIDCDYLKMLPLTSLRWENKFGGVARTYKWGTALVLAEYDNVHVTWLNDRYATPAWYLIK